MSWQKKYLEKAEFIAQWSKDPSRKCGCVITTMNDIPVGEGFNGLSKRVKDTWERLNNRDLKLQMILHAEENALIFSSSLLKTQPCRVYTWPFPPCSKCASILTQYETITEIVAPNFFPPKWEKSCKLGKELFEEAGVKVTWV